jgi:hypothetical protein
VTKISLYILVCTLVIAGTAHQARCQQLLQCSSPQTKAADINPSFIQPLSTEEGYKLLANFENMHWDNQNRPQAVAQINGHNAQAITLTPDSSGKWNWQPQIK